MSNIRLLSFFTRKNNAASLSEGKEVFLTAFPNPGRIGCPNPSIILRLASGGEDIPVAQREKWLAHVSSCSPCALDYNAQLSAAKRSQTKVILALCAAVAIIGIGIGFWLGQHSNKNQKSISSNNQSQKTLPGKEEKNAIPKPELKWEVAQLDLRPQSVTRGESPRADRIPSFPRSRLELSIILPLGSKEGDYEVRLIQRKSNMNEVSGGIAIFENHKTLLKVRIDMTGFQRGLCQLAIGLKGKSAIFYVLQLL